MAYLKAVGGLKPGPKKGNDTSTSNFSANERFAAQYKVGHLLVQKAREILAKSPKMFASVKCGAEGGVPHLSRSDRSRFNRESR